MPDWLLLYNNVTNFKHWFAVVCGTAFEIEIYGKELPAMAIKRVFQKEPVLSIAACLALVSSCFVLPDAEYLGYIDFRTLAILFSLMTVMAGLRGQGVFDRLGHALLSHTRTTLQLTAVLVGLCFFSSMVITNDVSLLTFVPFTFVVVNSLDAAVRDKRLLPIVCMQTIAANLGSMLTPLGNPQNLYLYGKSGMDMGSFVLLMLPYSILSLALLALWAVGLCRRGAEIPMAHSAAAASPNKALLSLYSILFVLCLLVVLRVLPYGIALVAVLACVLLADRNTLCRVDYSLILTFVALFIFIGNLGRFAASPPLANAPQAARVRISCTCAERLIFTTGTTILLCLYRIRNQHKSQLLPWSAGNPAMDRYARSGFQGVNPRTPAA